MEIKTKPYFLKAKEVRKVSVNPKKVKCKRVLPEDALPKMYVEWLRSDDSQATVVKRWQKRVAAPVNTSLGRMLRTYCSKAGGEKEKQDIRHIKKEAIVEAKKRSYDEVKDAVKEQQVKSALDHILLMDRSLSKSAKTIDSFRFKTTIDADLDTLKKHDDLARRAFGIDHLTEESVRNSGQLNLAVLINLPPKEAHNVVEAQLCP